ncbi:hypothetical protein D3C72_1186390 [compost metagenome]
MFRSTPEPSSLYLRGICEWVKSYLTASPTPVPWGAFMMNLGAVRLPVAVSPALANAPTSAAVGLCAVSYILTHGNQLSVFEE